MENITNPGNAPENHSSQEERLSTYHEQPGMSFHKLKDLATVSPAYYQQRHVLRTIHDEDRDALRLGRLIHLAVLEPGAFAAARQVPAEHLTPGGALSAKPASKAWAATVAGTDWGTPDELALCARIAAAVRENEEAARLIDAGQREVERFAIRDGHPVKGKADLLSGGEVWDLKTTRDLNGILREIRDYAYAEQLCWYADIFGADVGGLIMVEKDLPHRCVVVRFDQQALIRAARRVGEWWRLYVQCQESDAWPNVPPPLLVTAEMLDAA